MDIKVMTPFMICLILAIYSEILPSLHTCAYMYENRRCDFILYIYSYLDICKKKRQHQVEVTFQIAARQ